MRNRLSPESVARRAALAQEKAQMDQVDGVVHRQTVVAQEHMYPLPRASHERQSEAQMFAQAHASARTPGQTSPAGTQAQTFSAAQAGVLQHTPTLESIPMARSSPMYYTPTTYVPTAAAPPPRMMVPRAAAAPTAPVVVPRAAYPVPLLPPQAAAPQAWIPQTSLGAYPVTTYVPAGGYYGAPVVMTPFVRRF